MEGARKEIVRPASGDDERLDRYLSRTLGLSRTRIARLVDEGHVRVDGVVPRKSDPVAEGQTIEVLVPAPEPIDVEAEALPIDVVYEDPFLMVVNKPAGMVVHPGPGHPRGTLVNALLHHTTDLSGIGGALRPGIVHRLDRDTSGLLVVAKTDEAHRGLSDALRRREVRRLYRAASWGHLDDERRTVDAPVGRHPGNRKRMAVVAGGRRAITRIRVTERWVAADLLDVALGTGRTHQIRVHLAHLGHPVLGDAVYGSGWERGIGGDSRLWARELARRVPRQFLHAWRLAFVHPVRRDEMRFEAPLPDDLERAARWARGQPK